MKGKIKGELMICEGFESGAASQKRCKAVESKNGVRCTKGARGDRPFSRCSPITFEQLSRRCKDHILDNL
jgi:hypothetical protein